MVELPGLDGARIAILGLHHGERGTTLHLLASGVTLEDDWKYARGVRPLPVLWMCDSSGRWLTSPPKLPGKQRNAPGEPDEGPEPSGAEAVSSW